MQSVSAGDTAFILISAALVLLMTPALGLFYGGMVRNKNVLGTIMQSLIMISIISFEWVYVGYSMSFGPDVHGLVGDLSWLGLRGVGTAPSPVYATTIPHLLFMIYQCMFAVITPALITGAFAERMRFGPFVVFSLLWALLVYNPVCHWIWGSGGWLAKAGVLDFAGGLVVHLTSGATALAAAIIVGPRRGFKRVKFMPHNLPMTLLGTGLLWFGWLDLMLEAPWQQTALRQRPLRQPTWQACPQWPPGVLWKRCGRERPPHWGLHQAQLLAWPQSHRLPVSSLPIPQSS